MYLGWGVLEPTVFNNEWFLSVGVTFRVKTRQTGLAAVRLVICLFNWLYLAVSASLQLLEPRQTRHQHWLSPSIEPN
jgi:hypothetical protein